MFSTTEENYLKAIFSLESNLGTVISTNHIAKKLETKASSVTDMIKKLALKNLLVYTKYKGVSLSSQGRKIATSIVRKHRLWETFLVDKLGFNWDEVHDIAEQLEHIKSDKLILKLDSYLEYPQSDPHGDPIPDKNGLIRKENRILLSDSKKGEKYKIIGIKDSSDSFLQYLDSLKINIKTKIKIVEKMTYDNSILLEINGVSNTLSAKVCSNLFVI